MIPPHLYGLRSAEGRVGVATTSTGIVKGMDSQCADPLGALPRQAPFHDLDANAGTIALATYRRRIENRIRAGNTRLP
jgi:hypothetical protein